MTYRVIIEPTAERGIREAVRWLAGQASPAVAARWYNGLIRKLETLKSHPNRCPIAAETCLGQLRKGSLTARSSNGRIQEEAISWEFSMEEVLTIDQIKARYAPDWVLIGEPETDECQRLRAGRVLFHSPDREEVYRKAIELRPGHFAFRYLGEWPEDMAFVL